MKDRYFFIFPRSVDKLPDSYRAKVFRLQYHSKHTFKIVYPEEQSLSYIPHRHYLKDVSDEDLTYLKLLGVSIEKTDVIFMPNLTEAIEARKDMFTATEMQRYILIDEHDVLRRILCKI